MTDSDGIAVSSFILPPSSFELARLRTYPQHTRAWLPLLRSRPGGVHRRSVVRSPKSDKFSNDVILNCRMKIVKYGAERPSLFEQWLVVWLLCH